ncbi:3-deoxy-7-phosphoheptulonate synthase [Azotosporobacter soli]|uniref:3-deoxy-7-phosphoheptulonate synthase n=1 Tax=Azotosporobacter soli TaxID=3055040 RepID=UPI0031FE8714
MVIVMNRQAKLAEIERVEAVVAAAGLTFYTMEGIQYWAIGVKGETQRLASVALEALPGVERIVRIQTGYKLVSRELQDSDSIIDVDGVKIGGGHFAVMAGPCAVESREQLLEAAEIVKAGGATFLRGGAYKPRTSPYDFQGLEEQGLAYLAEASERTGLKVVTEVTETTAVERVAHYADVLQVGARNMQNFALLKAVGQSGKAVLLKRGMSATINEWLQAAEYIVSAGNPRVILCERGIRTFEEYTRNTLDLSAVSAIKRLSHLPVIADPSHGTGKWHLVKPMALAALAAGSDGLMIEVHPNPAEARCDGPQSLNPENYHKLMQELQAMQAFLKGRPA